MDRYNCWERGSVIILFPSLKKRASCKLDDVDSLQELLTHSFYNTTFTVCILSEPNHAAFPVVCISAAGKTHFQSKGVSAWWSTSHDYFWLLLSRASLRSFIFSYANVLINISQWIKLSLGCDSFVLSGKLTFAAGRTVENPNCPRAFSRYLFPSCRLNTMNRVRAYYCGCILIGNSV